MADARGYVRDPRHFQIAILGGLLVFGVVRLDFEISPARAALTLGLCLACQLAVSRRLGQPFDPRSALISGLSLCLLLRTGSWLLVAAAAILAIGSKAVFRLRGKHLFNPTNFALVVLLLGTEGVWVSSGQWGSTVFLAFLFACLGGLVATRAARADVSLGFAAFYAAVLLGRSLWLGQPAAIPLHQLSSGSFLLFTFFMISDPKTTPDSRAGRLAFALLVALGAGFVQFVLYRPNGLLLSLAFASPLVPLLDLLLPGERYSWKRFLPTTPRARLASTAA